MDIHDSTLFDFYSIVQGYVFSPAFAEKFDLINPECKKLLIDQYLMPYVSKLKALSLSPILDASVSLYHMLLRFEVYILGRDFPLCDLYLLPKDQFNFAELLKRETSELLDDLGFLLRINTSFPWDVVSLSSDQSTGSFSSDFPLQGADKAAP